MQPASHSSALDDSVNVSDVASTGSVSIDDSREDESSAGRGAVGTDCPSVSWLVPDVFAGYLVVLRTTSSYSAKQLNPSSLATKTVQLLFATLVLIVE